jgi:hypothetical protein
MMGEKACDLLTKIESPHAKSSGNNPQVFLQGRRQAAQFGPEQRHRNQVGWDRFEKGHVLERWSVPGVKVGAYLRAQVIAPGQKDIPAGRVARYGIGGQQSEREPEFFAYEFDAAQMSDIREPRRLAGVPAAKKPLFFDVYAYHQFQMEFTSGSRVVQLSLPS